MIFVIKSHAIAVEKVIYTYLESRWYTCRSNKDGAAHHKRGLIIPFLFYIENEEELKLILISIFNCFSAQLGIQRRGKDCDIRSDQR